jgi:hypothetical protein
MGMKSTIIQTSGAVLSFQLFVFYLEIVFTGNCFHSNIAIYYLIYLVFVIFFVVRRGNTINIFVNASKYHEGAQP